MRHVQRIAILLGLIFISLEAGSCSRFDSTGPPPECVCAAPLAVTLAFQGTELDELLSLEIVLEEARLLRSHDAADGSDSTDILRSPRELEVLGLTDEVVPLATGFYLEGTYDRLLVRFAAGAPRARSLPGAPFDVRPPARPLRLVTLDAPIVVAAGEIASKLLLLTLEVEESMERTDPGGAFQFEPRLRARILGDTEALPATPLRGRAAALSNTDHGFGLYSGTGDLHDHTGLFAEVGLNGETMYLDHENRTIDGREEFLRRVGRGAYQAVVRGHLMGDSGGFGPRFVAGSVQLGRERSDPISATQIVGAGRVVGALPGGSFSVRVTGFEEGKVAGEQLLQGLDDPWALELRPGLRTLFTDASGAVLGPESVMVGARVRFTIEDTHGPPELLRVAIASRPSHRGFLTDLGNLQGAPPRMTLRPGEAAIEAGRVAGATTEVVLELTSILVTLDVEGGPSLPLDAIPPGLVLNTAAGLWVKALGPVTGTPAEPVIASAALVVRPGRLSGLVMGTSPLDAQFQCTVGAVAAPFGGLALSPPLTARIAPGCVFRGAATNVDEFFGLHQGLEPGDSLGVEVSGIRGEFTDEVIAFEIRATVQ